MNFLHKESESKKKIYVLFWSGWAGSGVGGEGG